MTSLPSIRTLAVTFGAALLTSLPLFSYAQFDPKAKSLAVDSDREGFILLDLPTSKMKLSPFVVFVRPNGSEFEIIARGKIETIQDGKILVSLDRESILKFPLKGDLAVPLGTPKDWPRDTDERVVEPPIRDEEITEFPDPGYFEFVYGTYSGSLDTSASDNKTNDYKDIKSYSPDFFRLTYYTDMFWHLGLQAEHWGGDFPTRTYFRNSGLSSESVTNISFNYRFSRRWYRNRIRPVLRLVATDSEFKTINPDEALLSTGMSGYGAGARFEYEQNSLLYAPRVGRVGFAFTHAYAGLDLLPFVVPKDSGTTTRGSNGGAFITDIKIGAAGVAYFDWIPIFKRWTIEAGYGGRITNLKFSGPTTKNPSDFYVIPEGTTSTEISHFFFITLGLRLPDALGQALKPR